MIDYLLLLNKEIFNKKTFKLLNCTFFHSFLMIIDYKVRMIIMVIIISNIFLIVKQKWTFSWFLRTMSKQRLSRRLLFPWWILFIEKFDSIKFWNFSEKLKINEVWSKFIFSDIKWRTFKVRKEVLGGIYSAYNIVWFLKV